jgi:hypothetical protein
LPGDQLSDKPIDQQWEAVGRPFDVGLVSRSHASHRKPERHVGGSDEQVIELNQQAMALMHAPVRLEIVPGATHLFEEPGTLEQVARLAGEWFVRHLTAARARAGGAGDGHTGGEEPPGTIW